MKLFTRGPLKFDSRTALVQCCCIVPIDAKGRVVEKYLYDFIRPIALSTWIRKEKRRLTD